MCGYFFGRFDIEDASIRGLTGNDLCHECKKGPGMNVESMMEKRRPSDFPWALAELLAGRIVRRSGWCPGAYIQLDRSGLVPTIMGWNARGDEASWLVAHADLLADDWQHGQAAEAR